MTLPFAATVPPYRPSHPHRGVDLAPWPGSLGRPIRAALAGTVARVSYGSWFGNYVVTRSALPRQVGATDMRGSLRTIMANEPVYVIYAHMDSTAVRQGQHVGAGANLGTIGNTGFSFGPHLHLEMRLGDYAARDVIDPMDVLTLLIAGLAEEVVHV